MRILKDIKCNIDNNDFVGKIVIQDDNKYEGIMVDVNTKKKYLVMGVISNKHLEFMALHRKCKDPVYFIETELINKEYLGNVYSIKDNQNGLVGKSSIKIIDPNYYRNVNDGEIIGILAKTHILKAEIKELNKEQEKTVTKVKVHK